MCIVSRSNTFSLPRYRRSNASHKHLRSNPLTRILPSPNLWLRRHKPTQIPRDPIIIARKVHILLPPSIHTRYLDQRSWRADRSVIDNLDVCAVDVELGIVEVGEDVLPAEEVLAWRGGGGDGEVPL